MTDYALTKRAEADLFDVFFFGYEQFGVRPAENYAGKPEHTFQLLADFQKGSSSLKQRRDRQEQSKSSTLARRDAHIGFLLGGRESRVWIGVGQQSGRGQVLAALASSDRWSRASCTGSANGRNASRSAARTFRTPPPGRGSRCS